MLRGSNETFLSFPDMVFELPGLTVSISHADHDGGSPSQGKEAAKGDEKSQGLITIGQDILNKSKSRIATTRKEDRVNPGIDEIELVDEDCPNQDFSNMNKGNKRECNIKVKIDPAILFIQQVGSSHSFKAHQYSIY